MTKIKNKITIENIGIKSLKIIKKQNWLSHPTKKSANKFLK